MVFNAITFQSMLRHASLSERREIFEYLQKDPAAVYELVERVMRKQQALAAGDEDVLARIVVEERRQVEKFLAALKADAVKLQLSSDV